MKLKAYSKINLCLKVYKGWFETKHLIDSVFYLYTKLYDVINIKKSNDLYICYKDKGKEIRISDCIVSRSLRYLNTKYGIDIKYQIVIDKHIPFGAGLGGGSSDAAAVINYILRFNPNIELDLKEIAIQLGSDIPFFLSSYRMARVKSVGEFVAPIYNWKPKIELHFSRTACSTTKVFKSLEEDENYHSRVSVDRFIENHLYKQEETNFVYNDLTKYILLTYNELQDEYKKYTNNSFFTGAGSTIVTLKK